MLGFEKLGLTWTGATSTAWNESGNWVDTATLLLPSVPADGVVLNFGGATYGTPVNMPLNNDITPLTVGAINFVNNGVEAAAGPPVVLTQRTQFIVGAADLSQTVTLGGNVTSSMSGSAPANSSFTDTLNLNLVLNDSRIFNQPTNGTRSHPLNVFGLISEDGFGPYSLTKNGGSNLGLGNTANTFAGDMNINTGAVIANSIQPSGIASSIGQGSAINFNGGTLTFNTVGSVSAIAPTGSIDRAINLLGSGAINVSTLGNLTFNGTFTNTTATNKTFTLGGDAGPNTFQGNLVDNGTGVLSITKGGFSTWILTGSNSHTGLVDVPSGTLTVGSISDTVASNLGLGTNGLKLGQGVQTGTLNYTGNSATTTRQVQIGNNNGANVNGGASIAANGTNGGTGLKFTNAAFNTTRPDAVTTRTLTLGGSNTDANEISGTIIDLNTNLKLALAKSGVGNWIISGNNTYTGNNTISGGTLQVNDSSNGLGDSVAANAINLNGGTLSLRNDGAGNDGAIIYGSTSNAAGYNVQLSASSTINVGNLTANTSNTVNLGPLIQATVGARTLNVTGANGYTLTLPSFALNPLAGQTNTINPTSASLVITGNVTNPMSGFLAVPGANFNTLTLSGTSTGNRIDGVISDAVGGVLDEGDTRITKNGDSTWVLNGPNTYVGPTVVSLGTLLINGNSPLTTGAVSVNGGTLGGIGTLGGAVTVAAAGSLAPGNAGVGTLTLNSTLNVAAQAAGAGKLNFELGPIAASDKIVVGGVLTIGPASPTPGVLGFSDFNFSTLSGLENGTYKLITGASSVVGTLDAANLSGTLGAGPAQGTLQFTGTDLELVVTGAAASDPFVTWAGPGVDFDGDENNDGVDNGLAWLLGADSPDENALGMLPDVSQVGGSLIMSFSMLESSERDGAVLVLEHSSDLGISDPWTSVNVPDVDGGPTSGVTFDVTAGSPLNSVEATVSSSEAAAGKLFGRIKAER